MRKAWEKAQKIDSLMATWSLPVFSQDTQPLMSGSITQLFQVTHPLGQKSKKKKNTNLWEYRDKSFPASTKWPNTSSNQEPNG